MKRAVKASERFDSANPGNKRHSPSIQRRNMEPLQKDQELARSYLRGDRDEELFAQTPAQNVVTPKGSMQALQNSAKANGVLKIHGQRGLTALGGKKLLETVGKDVKGFPSFDEIMS
jgi:hypothetical protein